MDKQEKAHRRLLNAVISFVEAEQYGAKAEVLKAAIELKDAREESQQILYGPIKGGGR